MVEEHVGITKTQELSPVFLLTHTVLLFRLREIMLEKCAFMLYLSEAILRGKHHQQL